MLIARINEQKILKKCFESKCSEFIAMYGRRRVGKTHLITRFFEQQTCVFFRVTGIKDGKLSEQISQFTKELGKTFYAGASIKEQRNWLDAFDDLTDAINKRLEKNEKVVLFFDEFPWMATHKSKLLQALDHFWNHYWSHDPRIKLVICGSSASWIINKIINSKGGLHNRVTQKMQLKPFSLSEAKQYLLSRGIKLNHWQIAQIYMVTGGIPFYLSMIERGQSAATAIESLAFTENAPLLKEFNNLFSSLFDKSEPYIELLRLISTHRYGISQADLNKASELLTKGGRMVERLNALIETGFVLDFKPYQHKKKGLYYRVIDEFTLFYFRWIEPIRGTLQEISLEKGYWQSIQASAAWYSWAGYAFEALIYKHLSQIRKKLNISPAAIANTWRYVPGKKSKEEGAQIDLLFDGRDEAITLCEIKHSINTFSIDKQYAKQLMKKRDIFIKKTKTKKQVFIAMITTHGITPNFYADDLISGETTLEDLFEDYTQSV